MRGLRIFFPFPLILSCSSTWLLSVDINIEKYCHPSLCEVGDDDDNDDDEDDDYDETHDRYRSPSKKPITT